MKTNRFNQLSAIVLGVLLMTSAVMPVAAQTTENKQHQTVTKTNVKGNVSKVSYTKEYGHTYATITGKAWDPTDKKPVVIEYYFRSQTDPEFGSYFITDGVTDGKDKFWMTFKPATKGWIVVYAKDNQTEEYRFLGEIKVKALK